MSSMPFDEQTFETYMNERSGRMYAFIQNKVRNWDTTDDLFQDVFVKVYHYIKKNDEYPSQALLYTIARNVIIDFVRKRENKITKVDFDTTPEILLPTTEYREAESHLDSVTYWESIGDFDIDDLSKQIAWLHLRHGFSFREIETKLGIARTTAHHKFERVKNLLRKKFSDNQPL